MEMKKYLISIILIVLLCSSTWATSTSLSYRITTQVLDSAGGTRQSYNYQLLGKARGIRLNFPTSQSYIIHEGFIPTAFPALALLVTGISPNSAYNTGTIIINDLSGAGFAQGAIVSLMKAGEPDIVAANVNVVNSSQITCDFDLTSRVTGAWSVVVTNPNTQTGSLTDAFTINTLATTGRAVNSPNPFNPLDGPTTILYQLNQDANVVVLIFNISHELVYKRDYSSGTNGGQTGDNNITWDGYNDFAQLAANGVYFFRVVDKGSGKILVKGKIAVSR
jgi:hypothetical protein